MIGEAVTRDVLEAQLRAAGFPIAGPDDAEPGPVCECTCSVFSHARRGASVCVNHRTCRCTGWVPARRRPARS